MVAAGVPFLEHAAYVRSQVAPGLSQVFELSHDLAFLGIMIAMNSDRLLG